MMSAPYRRVPHWEGNLARLMAERTRTPFAWGTNDCVTFAADAVQAITGHDPIAGIRGTWRSLAEAERVLRRFAGSDGGLEGAIHAMAQREGWPEVPWALAQRGDLVMLEEPEGNRLAVVTGQMAVSPGEAGLIAGHMVDAFRAWSI